MIILLMCSSIKTLFYINIELTVRRSHEEGSSCWGQEEEGRE